MTHGNAEGDNRPIVGQDAGRICMGRSAIKPIGTCDPYEVRTQFDSSCLGKISQ